jgi:hypothetical protein
MVREDGSSFVEVSFSGESSSQISPVAEAQTTPQNNN